MSAWVPMWRRARRLALRSPARSVATGSLVAMSVAVVVVLAAWPWMSGEAYLAGAGDTAGDANHNGVDAAYEVSPERAPIGPLPEVAGQIVEAQPPGSSTVVVEHFWGIRLAARSSMDEYATALQTEWDSSLVADTMRVLDGRLPGPGEVVTSPRIAAKERLGVGATMELSEPDATLRVVGVGSQGSGNPAELLTAQGEFLATGSAGNDYSTASLARVTVLTDVPAGEAAPEVLLRDPGSSAQQVQYPITSDELDMIGPRWEIEPSALVVMAVALGLAVVLTSGAAFGIGAARRRRAVGLLVANGADDATMRIAAVTEAFVVAAPAAVLGAVLPFVVSKAWIGLRAPRWDLAAALRFNPWTIILSCVFVVGAAVVGTLWFTRALRKSSIPALLDQRTWRTNRSGRPAEVRRLTPSIIAVSLLVLLVLGGMWSRTVGIVPAFSAVPVTTVVVGAFVLLVWLVMVVSRRLLARRVSGRIVMRDVMRRPAGAAAAAVVVAIWSALMIGSAAQARYEEVGTPDSTTSYGIVRDSGVDVGSGVVPTTSTFEIPSIAYDVPDVASGRPEGGLTVATDGRPAVVQRGTEPEPPTPIGDVQDHLARAGLPTVSAQMGEWTGSCAVCPDGYIPTVAVLSGTDGDGLSPEVNRLLSDGYVVTPMSIEIAPGTELEGMPIATAPVDVPGAVAVLLASEVPEGAALANPSTVLVGSTSGLDGAARSAVATVLVEAGAMVNSSDSALAQMIDNGSVGDTSRPVDPTTLRTWALWLLPLLLVTLAATSAHRREHGEAARVLDVLGAGSRTARRLASRTAALIAGLGVTVGIGVGLIGVIAAVGGSREASLVEVLWSVEFLGACALAGVVPVIVGVVAWILPPARQPGPGALAPA